MHSQQPILSVVIPAFNEEERLPQCIDRIREALEASPELAKAYEIIVCDNNSTPHRLSQKSVVPEWFSNRSIRSRARGIEERAIALGEWFYSLMLTRGSLRS